MNLNLIIQELRSHCPVFAKRVVGAAEFLHSSQSAHLSLPAAYVVPLDDEVGPAAFAQGYRQIVTEGFSVIVALDNREDERGQHAVTTLEQIRAMIWRALLGWSPNDAYSPIIYEGGHLVSIDRARLFFAFDFSTQIQIVTKDTRQGQILDTLSPFVGINIQVDALEPMADPNAPQHQHPQDPSAYRGGSPGPDGRIEHHSSISLT